ncbi:MAG: hypothetical protein OEZ34_09695, partial [Spirochaetia bacterium]|nr:hypothetical protein [Spirochaetia bacterium]
MEINLKKSLFLICAMTLLTAVPAAGENHSAPEREPESTAPMSSENYIWLHEDFTVENKEESAEKILLYLIDKENKKFTVEFMPEENLKEHFSEKLKKFKDLIENVGLYKIRSLHILVREKSLDAHVIPESFECSGKEINESVPAGIFFTQTIDTMYNF